MSVSSVKSRSMTASAENVDYFKFVRIINTIFGMPLYVYTTEKLGRKFGKLVSDLYVNFSGVTIVSNILTFFLVFFN